jgi:hypothetical protein
MARFSAGIALALVLVISVLIAARPVAAGEASDTEYSLGDPVPLDESDLENITFQVMRKTPPLSSSPGIKFASAQRQFGQQTSQVLSIPPCGKCRHQTSVPGSVPATSSE